MGHLTAVDYVAMTLGAIIAGMALVLLLSHTPNKTNLSISAVYLTLGVAIMLAMPMANEVDADTPAWQPVLLGLLTAVFLAASASYMAALLETSQAPAERVRPIRLGIKICYAIGVALGGLILLFPEPALNDVAFSLLDPSFGESKWSWAVGPYLLAGSLYVATWVAIARQPLDVGEPTRATCAAVISLLITIALVLPQAVATGLFGLGVLVGLYGQYRYFIEQGKRSAFLSLFLSSQVAESVRLDGLTAVMQPGERELTVVACDLRGFTAYAEAVPSQAVIDLLSDYYEAVGVAVAEVHGTVKDYAGDGVLILLGAPLPRDDHAPSGLQLARRLHEVLRPVLLHWATAPHPLGVGIGVATGVVTVGAVGSTSRMEYTAVGTAVNLAARLCSAAKDGETLIAESTVALTGVDGLEARAPMPIKGLAVDQTVYAL